MTARDVLFVSAEYIKSITNISDNVAGQYILPAIRISQDTDMQEMLGTKLYRHLQELIFSGDIELEANEQFKDLLDNYLQYYLSYLVVSELCLMTSFKITNAGIVRSDTSDFKNADMSEVEVIRNTYKYKADFYKSRTQDFLIRYHQNFQPYLTNEKVNELRTNLYSAATCGIWLGGARGKGWRKYISLRDKYENWR